MSFINWQAFLNGGVTSYFETNDPLSISAKKARNTFKLTAVI